MTDLLTVERRVFPDESRKRSHRPQSARLAQAGDDRQQTVEVVHVAGQRLDVEHVRRQGGQLGAPLRLPRRDEGDAVEALGDLGEHAGDERRVDGAAALAARRARRRRERRGRSRPRPRQRRVALADAARDVNAGGSTRLAITAPTG